MTLGKRFPRRLPVERTQESIQFQKTADRRRCAGLTTLNFSLSRMFVALMALLCMAALPAAGQTGGEGALQGTITDTTGAVVPGATVTITNTATGVQTIREATDAGFYNISPVPPGTY